MSDQAAERAARADERRLTWTTGPLQFHPPIAPTRFEVRMAELERLRRIAFAIVGIAYPEGPTPMDERRSWPVRAIDGNG